MATADTYFARETRDSLNNPQTPPDPTWLLYSAIVDTTENEFDPAWEESTGIGNWMPQDKHRGQEETELSVEYELQRFPVNNSGDPLDAVADFPIRDPDHYAITHSFLQVHERQSIATGATVHSWYFGEHGGTHPEDTTPSASELGSRTEVYARGCVPSEWEFGLAPDDGNVIVPSLTYTAHKYRIYQFDQPPSGSTLAVRSTAMEDSGATVNIEPVGGGSGEGVTLDSSDATNLVPTSGSYDSLRVGLDEECEGTIEVYVYDSGSSTAGQLLTFIPGSAYHDDIAGDHGVPMIGGGSLQPESELSRSIPSLDANMRRDGAKYAETVNGATISGENDVEARATDQGFTKDIRARNATGSIEATITGYATAPREFHRMLNGADSEIRFDIRGGEIVVPRAYVESPGSLETTGEETVTNREVTLSLLEKEDVGALVTFVPA